MPDSTVALLALLFLAMGALYASVGHAGASGYLASMALLGVPVGAMRPTALAVNVCVACIACAQFVRAGHFSWRLSWPFAVASVPAAFLGGWLTLPPRPTQWVIGAALLLAAARMAWMAAGVQLKPRPLRRPPLPVAAGCGGALGLLAGLSGTGGGIFLSPLLLVCRWADAKRTAATSAMFILLNSLAGLGGLSVRGTLPTTHLMVLAAAACAGGAAGAFWGSRHAPPRAMHAVLMVVLLVAGGKLLLGA